MVDLLTSQKLLWKPKSLGDDGRMFESKPLDQTDEPELVQEVKEARGALIEQVPDTALHSNICNISCRKIPPAFVPISYSCSQSQVADLDDEFAELLLTEYSDNLDSIPSIKVSIPLCQNE